MNVNPEQLIPLAQNYGYFLILPLSIIEGPIVTVLTGFIVSLGYLQLPTALLVVVLGDLLGDLIFYSIGRFGRAGFINTIGRFIGIDTQHVDEMEKQFKSNQTKSILIGKALHGVGSTILFIAGASKMKIRDFITYNMLGSIPKSFLLLLLGYYFGSASSKINKALDFVAIGGLVLVILALFASRKYFDTITKKKPKKRLRKPKI